MFGENTDILCEGKQNYITFSNATLANLKKKWVTDIVYLLSQDHLPRVCNCVTSWLAKQVTSSTRQLQQQLRQLLPNWSNRQLSWSWLTCLQRNGAEWCTVQFYFAATHVGFHSYPRFSLSLPAVTESTTLGRILRLLCSDLVRRPAHLSSLVQHAVSCWLTNLIFITSLTF